MAEPARRSKGCWQRVRLRGPRGGLVLDGWGVAVEWLGGVNVHRMTEEDPGPDLHDHPWAFVSVVLWGSYDEWRASIRAAADLAFLAEAYPETCTPGVENHRGWLSVGGVRLDEAHKTIRVGRRGAVTLCFRGPRRRGWGFYMSDGYVPEAKYRHEPRQQRNVTVEVGT